jgi:hypothetical protein
MNTKKPIRNETRANSAIQNAIKTAMNNPEKVLGHVEVTKVIREHMPLMQSDDYGPSIGQQIDGMLVAAVENGDEFQSFKLEFEPERWGQFVKTVTDAMPKTAY